MGAGGTDDDDAVAAETFGEADITADVPSSSRQLSIWLRRTRANKVRKVVREVYLRDDISPETFEGADQILVIDTNVALHQIDFIAEEECVNHVVVPYTVLQEVRNQRAGTYHRLRALCRVDAADGKDDAEADSSTATASAKEHYSNVRRGMQDMSKARNARRFYVFPNEFFRETYVERAPQETVNDRNDRAIRRVAQWYRKQLTGPEVVLLTDDRQCKARAVADGLQALTAREFVEKMRGLFPDAGEKLAYREESAAEVDAAAPQGVKRKLGPGELGGGAKGSAIFPAHLKASEIEQNLREGTLMQGYIRMHANTCHNASVTTGKFDVSIHGRMAVNRAVDGDVVAVELLDEQSASAMERASKRMRREGAEEAEGDAEEDTSKPISMTEDLKQEDASRRSSALKQGRVVGIIKRNWREYCGTLRPLHADRQAELGSANFSEANRLFIPADPRIPNITIHTRHSCNLEDKRIAVVMDSWDRFSSTPKGHWTRILGDVGDRSVESAVILHEHGVVTREFSDAILRCLPPADWQPTKQDLVGREDFRHVCVFSVDPPGCKDIDDAMSCQPLSNGNFRVGVHIADVTHFVHPRTAVDLEAAERCTTVYLVEKRTDMLPGLLTTDICSLRANVERITFSVIWELTPDACVVGEPFFTKAIIKSKAALSYAQAQAMIDDRGDNSEMTHALRTLNRLAKTIRSRRMEAGALELASQEVRFELDSETQDPTDVSEYKLRDTNKLIEEFMLLANQAVAKKILDSYPGFGVLRRHPPPKDEALKTLRHLMQKYGLDFKFGSNKELSKSLEQAVNPSDPYFNTLVRMMTTRCMNQAVYFCTGEVPRNLYSHYGLAMELYTHFTSPIRRYADILVHRLLAASLGIIPLPDELQAKPLITEQCEKINVRHRMAQWAGRASKDLHVFFFFNRKGKTAAEAVVTRIRRTGVQVVVQRYGIDGIVPMSDEEWTIEEEEQKITSRFNRDVVIRIFDHISVQIEADNSEFRNRTLLSFDGVLQENQKEAHKDAEDSRRKAEKEMFPDRLEQEVN